MLTKPRTLRAFFIENTESLNRAAARREQEFSDCRARPMLMELTESRKRVRDAALLWTPPRNVGADGAPIERRYRAPKPLFGAPSLRPTLASRRSDHRPIQAIASTTQSLLQRPCLAKKFPFVLS